MSELSSKTRRWQTCARVVLGCYWLVMIAGTHWPTITLEQYPHWTDKVLHACGYALFAFLIGVVLTFRRPLGWRGTVGIALFIVVYSAIDETTQPLVGRTCDLYDAFADWTGASVGLGVFHAVQSRLRRAAGISRPVDL